MVETGSSWTKRPRQFVLAATYIVEDNQTHDVLGYFSLLHDKIDRHIADKATWNKLSDHGMCSKIALIV